jgi:UDP-2,4-diacetamido-2,4,6-trideoxy-beta-L-altropyranose hydrolase
MKVFIRTDASVAIGSGHLMRCLTLAEELHERGAKVEFICREHPGNLIQWISDNFSFVVHKLPMENGESISNRSSHTAWLGSSWEADAHKVAAILRRESEKIDLLIVDHYALDVWWEQSLKPLVDKILVIDDLANRQHDCNLLLDQNFYLRENRYQGLLSDQCVQLLGPKYALLRKEFAKIRKKRCQRARDILRVIIFFGGSDPTNETGRALSGLQNWVGLQLEIDVVVGASNPNREILQKMASAMRKTSLHVQVSNMAELIAKADIGIGAGGSVHWERCCLGLPSIITTIADNQIETTNALAKNGLLLYLGVASELDYYDFRASVGSLTDPQAYSQMARRCMEMVDGLGVSRLTELILEGKGNAKGH